MLSKYAHIGFETTDNMTILELDTVTSILNDHYEEMQKLANASRDPQGGNGAIRTINVNDLSLDDLP